MKLLSKKIKVKDRKIKANAIKDLKMFGSTTNYFFYKATDQNEIKIIKNNFEIIAEFRNDIYYEISFKQMRKIKILVLEGNLILKQIIENSKFIDIADVLTAQLSYELAQGIDREIIKSLMS